MALLSNIPDIRPIPAFRDNYIWLITWDGRTCVVDPGDAVPVLSTLTDLDLCLDEVWITHLHPDHVGGLAALKNVFPGLLVRGPVCSNPLISGCRESQTFGFGKDFPLQVSVWEVPGHTPEHIAFIVTDGMSTRHVFCGDTLFSAGCGRLLGGTIMQLHDSLRRFLGLPSSTLFYAAHEYTLSNLRFARAVEPTNIEVNALLHAFERDPASHIPSLPTPLEKELLINPFLRIACGSFDTSVLRSNGEMSCNSIDIMRIIRKMKDDF